MRDFHLRFALGDAGTRWNVGLFDLLGDEDEENQLPQTGGAYVIGTAETMLTYPWGTSPIFYIGKTRNLRQRLSGHRRRMLSAREDHEQSFWPRHQYGAALGAHVAWYSRHGPQHPQNIEAELIEAFYYTFGAIPSANATWPGRIRPRQEGENE